MEAPARAHVITGNFPPGMMGGHDHDWVRLRLLEPLYQNGIHASVSNDFSDVEKWLPVSRLLVTYVAGPYPDAEQSRAIQAWMEGGGRWVGLHGTSGGRAVRVEGQEQRRTVKLDHHAVLGSYFLTHPAIRKIRVDVTAGEDPLTAGLPPSFEVTDEPYFLELTDPQSIRILLSAEYGPEVVSSAIGTVYQTDTSLLPDDKTRVLGYLRQVGRGGVLYIALGHCHNRSMAGRSTEASGDGVPPIFRGSWDSPAFQRLMLNALAWGVDT